MPHSLGSRPALKTGAFLIAAAVASLAACADDPTRPKVTYHLELVSGSGQVDTVAALLPQPLVVRARTSTNLPAAGRVVTLVPSAGSGSLSTQSVVTDAAGLAEVRWTLGTAEGPASVIATLDGVVGASVTFSATATAPPLRAVALAAGYEHNCAVTSEHRMYCWGLNEHGQLGDGGTTSRNSAGLLPGALLFDRVAAGANHTCAVTTTHDMHCWGRNNWGQLGDGSTVTRRSPTHVAPDIEFVDVIAGAEFTCGLSVMGSVHCWGFMLGTQSTNYWTPAKVSGTTVFRSLGSSDYQACGMGTDDAAYCLGATWTYDEATGGSAFVWRPDPARLATLTTFAGGLSFMCGLDAAGAASCWGDNTYGQLGTGAAAEGPNSGPVSGGLTFRGLYAGYAWSCGVTMTGPTYCWGHNMWGVQGAVIGQRYVEPSPHLLAVPAGLTFTTMDGGLYHMCGIAPDSRVYCWGGGFRGQLGDGVALTEFYNRALPAPVIRR